MDDLLLLGLNHTTAALEVRERLAFDVPRHRAALGALRERFGDGSEAVLLSTCNRVEIYAANRAADVLELTRFLGEFHHLDSNAFSQHLYARTGRPVVEHLFNVATSLDSMVLGETQIL